MKHNLRALCLAAIALVAIGALMAPGAVAAENHEFTSEEELTRLTEHGVYHELHPKLALHPIVCTTVPLEGNTNGRSGRSDHSDP